MELERIFSGVNCDVMETAAIGVPPSGGGPEQLVVAVVLKDQSSEKDILEKLKLEFNLALQKKLNPLFKVNYLCSTTTLLLFDQIFYLLCDYNGI